MPAPAEQSPQPRSIWDVQETVLYQFEAKGLDFFRQPVGRLAIFAGLIEAGGAVVSGITSDPRYVEFATLAVAVFGGLSVHAQTNPTEQPQRLDY